MSGHSFQYQQSKIPQLEMSYRSIYANHWGMQMLKEMNKWRKRKLQSKNLSIKNKQIFFSSKQKNHLSKNQK